MSDVIIGGVIAAGAGLISGIISGVALMIIREGRQRKATELGLAEELYEEVKFNRSLLADLRSEWRNMDFETSSYQNNKGQIGFLPTETRRALMQAHLAAICLNKAMAHRREVSSTDSSFPTGELEGALQRSEDGLQAWLKSRRK